MAKFCRINKSCKKLLDPRSKYCVNFKVLFEGWGIQLNDDDVEETLISTSRALQLATKYMLLKSIIKSQHIIPTEVVNDVIGTSSIPDLVKHHNMSLQELRNLKIEKVEWYS